MKPSRNALLRLGLILIGAMGGASAATAADTPQSQILTWTAQARGHDPAYTASAERGRALFLLETRHSEAMPNCAACHTSNPANEGKHAVTAKRIAPLSPRANPERFTDAAKSEKWFKRNCNDVLGRVCTPAEKADVLSFLMTQR